MGFLRQVMGNMYKRHRYGTWRKGADARVLKEAGNHTMGTYIDKWQETVVEWVVLRPILDVCDRETC